MIFLLVYASIIPRLAVAKSAEEARGVRGKVWLTIPNNTTSIADFPLSSHPSTEIFSGLGIEFAFCLLQHL